MTAQPELDFSASKRKRISDAERLALIESRANDLRDTLKGRGWVKSKTLFAEGFTDRELRDIVEHNKAGSILS